MLLSLLLGTCVAEGSPADTKKNGIARMWCVFAEPFSITSLTKQASRPVYNFLVKAPCPSIFKNDWRSGRRSAVGLASDEDKIRVDCRFLIEEGEQVLCGCLFSLLGRQVYLEDVCWYDSNDGVLKPVPPCLLVSSQRGHATSLVR